MKSLRIYPSSINRNYLEQVADELRDGGVVIYPTDTFYALGCSALNNRAIERLCKLKGINPLKETLSVVCSDISQASEYARIDNRAFAIMRRNLPGPFTFILPAATTLPKVFKGRRTVGIRVPDNTIATALAEELGNPLLSTSVSAGCESGENDTVSAETIESAYEDNPMVSLMINGGDGACQGSTVVDLTDSSSPVIVRQGAGMLDYD